MKKIIVFAAIISFYFAAGQEKPDKGFYLEPMFRLHAIYPVSFGDNYLADANDGKLSFGINMSMFEYRDFRFVFGYDHIYYSASDVYKTADVHHSTQQSVYGIVTYEFLVYRKFSVQPYIGYGWSSLNFRRADEKTGLFNDSNVDAQTGSNWRAGFYLDYKFDKVIGVFAGIAYVDSKYGVKTARELESFYEKSQVMQINVGLKIGYSMKNKVRKVPDDQGKPEAP